MSSVSNRHSFAPFVAGESKPLTGQRLLKIGFKQTAAMTKKGEKALPSVFASVPPIDPTAVETHWADLLPHVGTWLESVQDAIARNLYERSKGQRTEVTDEELSIPSCVAWLNAVAAGERLSGDAIRSAAVGTLTDALTVIIADRFKFDLSTPEQNATVEKHVRQHIDVLCLLAGKDVVLGPAQEKAIRGMLELVRDEDAPIWDKCRAKFAELTAKAAEQFESMF